MDQSFLVRHVSVAERLGRRLQPVVGEFDSLPILHIKMSLIFGQVPEWLKGADCKSASTAYSGSNPLLSTNGSIV